jgi:23S rRNA pseudouridine2605 synthase
MPEGGDARLVPMRLQKFLARAGCASRRGSEDLMTAGRVAVNGVVTTELGAKVDPLVDIVTVDGREVRIADRPVYLVLHKPRGVMTTMSDPQGRPTVASLVPVAENPGLFPVGRLDFDTTGLLLFTTDGELAHRLLHPRWKVPKTYRAVVDGVPDAGDLERLKTGIELDDGPTAPAQVFMLERRAGSALVEITITEGRKRQVRRMFSRVSHPVIDLERVSFGPVGMADLRPGEWRDLSATEVAALRRAAGMEQGAD